ncbi:MAG TPA: LuxR C-terminal-related transcriptional regulator [Candidatus Kapabacteria bacterium]|nr:LuxR C-terminal-related transcriptional regulator [Candidatus Kapabacteria bacterium]
MQIEMGTTDTGQIEQRLLMTSDAARKLELILASLPALVREQPSYAAGLASEGYAISVRLRNIASSAMLLYLRGCALQRLEQHTAALEDLREAHGIFSELQRHDSASSCALAAAQAFTGAGDRTQAHRWYHTALEEAGSQAPATRAAALESLGDLYASIGDYAQAMERYLESLALQEMQGDRHAAARILASLAALHMRTHDAPGAIEALERSIVLCRETGNRLGEIEARTRMAEIDLWRGEPRRAIDHALRALTIYDMLNDAQSACAVMILISEIHEQMGEPAAALAMAMRAYASLRDGSDDALRVRILLALGRLHAGIGEYDRALFIFDQVLGLARATGALQQQAEAHAALSALYHRLGRSERALEHCRLHGALREELAGVEKQRALAELQVRFDLERSDREREAYRLRAETLEAEARARQSEIAAMSLRLVQKNELLETLERRLQKLQHTTRAARAGNQEGSGDDSVERMIAELRHASGGESDWLAFEGQLDTPHQDFLQHLSQQWPALTPTELRICSLTRINLSTREIANLLFTSVRTVHTHRHNIRRKLGLSPRMNLTTFLAGLHGARPT